MSWATRMKKRPLPNNIDVTCKKCGAHWKTSGDADFRCLYCRDIIKAVKPHREEKIGSGYIKIKESE